MAQTPLYPAARKRIEDCVTILIRDQVTPWSFLKAGPPFQVKTFHGQNISYQGIRFEGSPQEVFWGRYIEPFLEDLCLTQISLAVAQSKERHVDARAFLPEVKSLLSNGISLVFQRMADVDRRLLADGFPDRIPLRSVEPEVKLMNEFLSSHVDAELQMWKPKHRRELWIEQNKFWVWAISIALGLIAIAIRFV